MQLLENLKIGEISFDAGNNPVVVRENTESDKVEIQKKKILTQWPLSFNRDLCKDNVISLFGDSSIAGFN